MSAGGIETSPNVIPFPTRTGRPCVWLACVLALLSVVATTSIESTLVNTKQDEVSGSFRGKTAFLTTLRGKTAFLTTLLLTRAYCCYNCRVFAGPDFADSTKKQQSNTRSYRKETRHTSKVTGQDPLVGRLQPSQCLNSQLTTA